MAEVKLKSGNTLSIGLVSFEDAKNLYQVILDEAKLSKLNSMDEVTNAFKDIFCTGFSSKKIEAALWVCFKKCIYTDKRGPLKIDKDTFEDVDARADYIEICICVAKEVTDPFVKGLYAEFMKLLGMITGTQP